MHNETTAIYIGLATLAALAFFALGYLIRKYQAKRKTKNAEDTARRTLETAKSEAEKIRHEAELQAKDLLLKLRTEFEKETKDRRQELVILEKRLIQKEENLDRKVDVLDRKEKDIDRREHSLSDKEKEIEELSGIETRSVVLGHLQRGGSPSPFDRILGTRLGARAMDLIVSGKTGHMVGVKGEELVSVPLSKVAKGMRLVPLNHELIKVGLSLGVSFGI